MSWQKVIVLAIFVVGSLTALYVTQGKSGEAIAYMLAGAAANQGAVSLEGKRHNNSQS